MPEVHTMPRPPMAMDLIKTGSTTYYSDANDVQICVYHVIVSDMYLETDGVYEAHLKGYLHGTSHTLSRTPPASSEALEQLLDRFDQKIIDEFNSYRFSFILRDNLVKLDVRVEGFSVLDGHDLITILVAYNLDQAESGLQEANRVMNSFMPYQKLYGDSRSPE